jgi:hypothetical protein
MKKIFLSLLVVLCIPFSIFGINGNGTFGSPYNGPLTSNMTWNGTVYINGNVSVNGFTLTISPGAIIVFLASGSNLITTGNGVLNASGLSSSMIRFTADFNNNGIYGEPGERWGHISFESMGSAGASLINNCIIEYGDVSNTSLPNQYGGGIHTSFTNLTISNCIIRNNKAGWGGGIFVNKNASPTITNCSIQNNTSISSGGGLYIWSNSASIITNCLIFSNASTVGGGGGGIFLGDLCGNVRIINCTIVNNTSNAAGKNIHLYINTNPGKPSFINCVVWNPANSIAYSGQTPAPSDFVNCAVQSPSYLLYTNWVPLNSSNTEPDGPNFNQTNGTDWSIKYISPCRDAGTSSGAPATDYLGNGRVYNYDIGAYELQYSRWTGASGTDWANPSNWQANVDPSSGSGDVYIPTNKTGDYPISDPSQNFTIGAGKFMILEPATQATLGTLTNNGTLKLNGSVAGPASLILTSYIKGSGATEEIQLFLTGGGTKTTRKWHYISSPVTSLAVSTFSPSVTLDLAQWIEPRPVTSFLQGWVAFDGYDYSTGLLGGPTFSNLDPGKAYDYYKNADYTFTFGGQLNTNDVTANLSYTSGNDGLYGLNLVGNPFSSGLDWDYIVANSFPPNTTKSLYFTRNNVLCSYIDGVGVPSDVNGIIPPMQGFFSKTYSAGNSIVLAAAARTQSNIHATYKRLQVISKGLNTDTKGVQIIPLVRLLLTDDTLSDETVVRFNNLAKSSFDYDYDALKLFLSPDVASIYSSMSGVIYAINGLPFPAPSVEIPITINIATVSSSKTITALQVQGLDNYDVTLTDNSTGYVANLKTSPSITFSADKGNIAGRFVLKIGTLSTGIENPSITSGKFNIYSTYNNINIKTLADDWDGKSGSVRIMDLSGKTKNEYQNIEFSKNSLIQVAAPEVKGIYIIEIKSGIRKYVGKVIIK